MKVVLHDPKPIPLQETVRLYQRISSSMGRESTVEARYADGRRGWTVEIDAAGRITRQGETV